MAVDPAPPPPAPAAGSSVADHGRPDDQPQAPPEPAQSGSRGLRQMVTNPANWRVRTKLIAILAVPVIAILVNAGIGASALLTATRDINRVGDLTEISHSATSLIHALQEERTYASAFAGTPASATSMQSSLESRRTATNDAYQAYQKVADRHRDAFGSQVKAALDDVSDRMSRLQSVRQAGERMTDSGSVRLAYTPLIQSLIDLVSLIPQGNDDQELLAGVNTTSHVLRASEALAVEQSLVYALLTSEQAVFTDSDYRAFHSADSRRVEETNAIQQAATPEQYRVYSEALNPDESNDVENTLIYIEDVLKAPVGQPLTNVVDDERWQRATQETVSLHTETSGALLDLVDERVGELRSDIQREALLSAVGIIVVLAAALISALLVARSLVRPLLTLRTAALDIAGRRLPEVVRRLRDSNEQHIDHDVEPVGIYTDEEIGEVARAFDAVHREAVRLASEQAALRNNVNAMFVNLSRRSQSLVERQLRLIDDLENREQDPDQLANLFKLDHLATRMRRNNESLLVLAGTDTARRWTHPVPLNEVVLAAISEVEQYTRIKQTTAAPVSIAGSGVSDVVHLIAELLENATSFSPPATDVLVSSHSLGPGAGAMIEIEDQGIGMPAKELERVNDRLANPPVIDVSVSRTMGLFAVGRLAQRHGIRVQLRESPSGGITAVVRLPAKLVTGDTGGLPGLGRPPGTVEAPRRPGPAIPRAAERNGAGAAGPTSVFSPSGPSTGGLAIGRAGSNGVSSGYSGDTGPFAPTGPLPAGTGEAESPATGPMSTVAPEQASQNGHHAGETTGEHRVDEALARGGEQPEDTGGYPIPAGPAESPDREPEPFETGPIPYQPEGEYRPEEERTGERTGENPATYPMPMAKGAAERQAQPEAGHDGAATAPTPPPADTTPTRRPSYSEPDTDVLSRPGSVFSRPPHRPSPEVTGEFPRTGSNLAAAFRTPRDTGPLARPEDTGRFRQEQRETFEETDTTPIFDSVSAWFQRRSPEAPAPASASTAARTPATPSQPARQDSGLPTRGVSPTRSPQPSYQGPGTPTGPQTPARGEPIVESPARGLRRPGMPLSATASAGSAADTQQLQGASANAAYSSPRTSPTGPQQPGPAGQAQDTVSWSSPADAGWKAAESLRQPTIGGMTRAGLPVRVPMSHLVPGSAEATPRRRPEPAMRSPEAVGGRLASFYQGVRQGRDVGADTTRKPRRDAQEER